MAVMMILAAATIPVARQLMKSFETSVGVRTLISAALCNARAIAAKEQRYAGLRFQRDIKGNQYMIFIIHDPTLKPLGFRAVEGKKPIKLPANIGIFDLKLVTGRALVGGQWQYTEIDVDNDALLDDSSEFTYFRNECTAFSIVFSPTGKLVVHEVRVLNRTNWDDVFNSAPNVDNNVGMFYEDDYPGLGFGVERSRKWFVVYDKNAFGAVSAGSRWTDYLEYLKNNETVYVNPRTGEVINY